MHLLVVSLPLQATNGRVDHEFGVHRGRDLVALDFAKVTRRAVGNSSPIMPSYVLLCVSIVTGTRSVDSEKRNA
jgi:hypothetical protein